MEIRNCTKDDIELVAHYVHRKNKCQESSFLCQDLDRIKDDFITALSDKSIQAMVVIDGTCKGYIQVVINSEYIPGDVIGPYFDDDALAIELLQFVRQLIEPTIILKFNIAPQNPLNLILIQLGAFKVEENYQLSLARSDCAKHQYPSDYLIDHSPKNDAELKQLYLISFKDTYMDFDSLLNYKNDNAKLVDLIENDSFIGFSYYQAKGYIDFLAIAEDFRNKGNGSKLLSSVIYDIFKDNSVQTISMNVDVANKGALSIYYKLGFKVRSEYISYQLGN